MTIPRLVSFKMPQRDSTVKKAGDLASHRHRVWTNAACLNSHSPISQPPFLPNKQVCRKLCSTSQWHGFWLFSVAFSAVLYWCFGGALWVTLSPWPGLAWWARGSGLGSPAGTRKCAPELQQADFLAGAHKGNHPGTPSWSTWKRFCGRTPMAMKGLAPKNTCSWSSL